MFVEMRMNGVGHLTVDKSMVRYSIWVAFTATLLLLVSCGKKNETSEETGNSKFLGFVGADSLSKAFEFNEGNPIEISLNAAQIDSKVKLSDLMIDYRLVSLKNWEGGVVGSVDKILFTDSLVFILDQYTYNSIQVFDLFTGEQVDLFYPTGEGPGEMKNISEFDLDESNRRILIYDNYLAKMLYFNFEGKFLFENRLPIRGHSFKIFPDNQLLFSSIGDANDHLGKTGNSDLFLLDSNYTLRKTYKYPKINQKLSQYIPRDVIRENGGTVTYFPRFSSELFQIERENKTLKPLIHVDLGSEGLTDEDLENLGPEFTSERREDKKFYGFGFHFVTPNWIGMKFDASRSELYVFHNLKSGEVLSGKTVDFDFEDLISFSFPMACRGNTCITELSLAHFRDYDLNDFFQKLAKENGRDYSKIKSFLESVEDFEQPILLVFTLK